MLGDMILDFHCGSLTPIAKFHDVRSCDTRLQGMTSIESNVLHDMSVCNEGELPIYLMSLCDACGISNSLLPRPS